MVCIYLLSDEQIAVPEKKNCPEDTKYTLGGEVYIVVNLNSETSIVHVKLTLLWVSPAPLELLFHSSYKRIPKGLDNVRVFFVNPYPNTSH